MFSKKIDELQGQEVNGESNTPSDHEEVVANEAAVASADIYSDTGSSDRFLKPSVISEGFEFTGEIKAAGSLTVEGSIVGKVTVDHLIVGVSGAVDGTVAAKTINVKGKLSGELTCNEITVGGRSSVDGKLTYSSITIQRGGSVKGDLKKA